MRENGHRVGHATKNGWASSQSRPKPSSLVHPEDEEEMPRTTTVAVLAVVLCIGFWVAVVMFVRRMLGG
jgi:hypothetical protein